MKVKIVGPNVSKENKISKGQKNHLTTMLKLGNKNKRAGKA